MNKYSINKHKVIMLLLVVTSVLGACSSTPTSQSNCSTMPTSCTQAKVCYAEKYSLDETGAKIVSKVAGCIEE